jgi:hypothetical protein
MLGRDLPTPASHASTVVSDYLEDTKNCQAYPYRVIIVYIENQRESVSRRNWVLPPPPPSECVSRLGPKGGEQHSLVGEGVGRPNSDDWTESLALCSVYCVSLPNLSILPETESNTTAAKTFMLSSLKKMRSILIRLTQTYVLIML